MAVRPVWLSTWFAVSVSLFVCSPPIGVSVRRSIPFLVQTIISNEIIVSNNTGFSGPRKNRQTRRARNGLAPQTPGQNRRQLCYHGTGDAAAYRGYHDFTRLWERDRDQSLSLNGRARPTAGVREIRKMSLGGALCAADDKEKQTNSPSPPPPPAAAVGTGESAPGERLRIAYDIDRAREIYRFLSSFATAAAVTER